VILFFVFTVIKLFYCPCELRLKLPEQLKLTNSMLSVKFITAFRRYSLRLFITLMTQQVIIYKYFYYSDFTRLFPIY